MSKKYLAILTLLLGQMAWSNDQIIIKLAPAADQQSQMLNTLGANLVRSQLMQPLTSSRIHQLSSAAGIPLNDIGPIAIGGRVLATSHDLSKNQMQQLLAKLSKIPGIAYAVENHRVRRLDNPQPNPLQWDMYDSNSLAAAPVIYYGDSFYLAQRGNNISSNGAGITVAVIDTGYVPHPMFKSQLIALPNLPESYGYTFIADCRAAGTCPTSTNAAAAYIAPYPNALDLGDGLTQEQYNQAAPDFQAQCSTYNIGASVWHGTHIMGTIAAQGYNDINGVLGGAYMANILPVRVLGKCGGTEADVINGMMWAAGLSTNPGAPNNTHTAQVLNLSLGGSYACTPAYQDAINAINAQNKIIVVAAGNQEQDVSTSAPANCNGVISVAAVGPESNLAYYTNDGNVTIAAAGGDDGYANGQIYSTWYNSNESYAGCSGQQCFTYES